MNKAFILLFLGFNSSFLFAQNTFSLSGLVQDSEKNSVFGEVILLNQEEKVLKYEFIEDGKFGFRSIIEGTYILNIVCLGYEDYKQKINLNQDIQLEVQLKTQSSMLEEVTVEAKRNTIENIGGNLKITIDNTPLENQATTSDLLSMLPKIMISPDRESISVIGKGNPLLYLENRRITVEELNSIPVNSIRDIEIINNPSAKYEAEGRCVILITRKSVFADGFQLVFYENASFKRKFNNYAGLNANIKKGKFEFKTQFNYNQLKHWESVNSVVDDAKNDIKLNKTALSIAPRPQFIVGTGVFYKIKENDYISANALMRRHTTTGPITGNSHFEQNNEVQEIETLSEDFEERNFVTTNLNYNKTLSPKSSIFAGLQYSTYLRALDNEISNSFDGGGFIPEQNRNQSFELSSSSARIDYESTIQKKWKIELGTNVSSSKAIALSDFEFIKTNTNESNIYNYEEKNFAFYSQLNGSQAVFDYSLGLRSETNQVQGGFEGLDDLTVDRNQTLLFPKASLSFPIDSVLQVSLNFGTSINRPHFLNASSISTYLNPFLEYSRNVNLKNTFTEELSLNVQKGRLSFEISHVNIDNPTVVSIRYDENQERLVSGPLNFEKERQINFSVSNVFENKLLTLTKFARISRSEIIDSLALKDEVKPFLYAYLNARIKLPADTVLGIVAYGMTKRKQGVVQRNGFVSLNTSITKSFGKNFNATIYANDIFRGMVHKDEMLVNEIAFFNTYFADARSFALSLRYTLGVINKSQYKNQDIDDNLDRM